MNIPDNTQNTNDYLKFDKRILLLTLSNKIIRIVIFSIIATVAGFVLAKLILGDSWKAQATLIRHKKNVSSKTDVPYLYSEMDYETVLQSIKTRKNLLTLIDSLHLNTTPEQIYSTIKVSRGRRSNLINISTINKNRDTAVNIANTVAEIFIKSYTEIINSATNKIYKYYQNELISYEKKIKDVISELDKFQMEKQILSLEKEVQNKYDNLKTLELDMMNAQLYISELKTKITDIAERIEEIPHTVELTSTITTTKQSQLKALKAQMAVYKKKYTKKNPKVMKLQDEIDALEKRIEVEKDGEKIPDSMTYGTNSIWQSMVLEKARYENEMVAISKKIKEYKNKIAIIKSQIQSLSPIEREYYDIVNRKTNLEEMLNKVKERSNEAKIAMDSNLSDFEILEYAIAPKYPEASGRKIIAIIIGILTFLMLMIYYMLKEILDFTVKSKYDIEEVLQVKCLEEIPNSEDVPKTVFYSKMQVLYGQIQNYIKENKTSLIAIGKDRFSSGATFIIQELINLALSQNKKVLWIESVDEVDDEILEHQINDVLYGKSNDKPNYYKLTDSFHVAYFVLNDQTFTKILSEKNVIDYMAKNNEYDIVFWELFNVDHNVHLFATISSVADLLAFVCRYRHSDKFKLLNSIRFLKKNIKTPIAGILNNSLKPYFKE
jgi:capsular polysaccharide biosynthesis protein